VLLFKFVREFKGRGVVAVVATPGTCPRSFGQGIDAAQGQHDGGRILGRQSTYQLVGNFQKGKPTGMLRWRGRPYSLSKQTFVRSEYALVPKGAALLGRKAVKYILQQNEGKLAHVQIFVSHMIRLFRSDYEV
jgi:hypothetical protein